MKKLFGFGLTIALTAWMVFYFNQSNPLEAKRLWVEKEGEEAYDGPLEAALFWEKRLQTEGETNPNQLNKAALERVAKQTKAPELMLGFEEMGPGNFGGRIRSIIIHPNQTDHMLIGSVSGGIWKTQDGGLSWRPVADFLPNIAIGCMVLDPDQPNRVFAGTGEGFFNADAARGLGIYVSQDFGETWSSLASTESSDFYYVNRLARIPGTSVLLAATRQGIFRSADLGATWNRTDGRSASSRGYVDLKVDPSNSSRIYAVLYGSTSNNRNVLLSNDGGLSFNFLNQQQGLPNSANGRMELGIGNDGVVYASCADDEGKTLGLYKSTDNGASWAKTPATRQYIERQGWYDLAVAVDPTNSNRLYLGAVDVFRSEDGGASIGIISNWAPNPGQLSKYVHADIHTIVIHPKDPRTLFVGCDGGIFKSTDGGDTFTPLVNNLRITQFYGMAVHPDGSRAIGGTQDNGTHLYYGDSANWLQWFSGDGGYCAWDRQDPGYVYGSTPSGGMFGSSNGGLATDTLGFDDEENAPFIQPFALDPSDGNRMLVGSQRLWFSPNVRALSGSTWQEISGATSAAVSAIAINPVDGSNAYYGLENGTVVRVQGLGSTNTIIQTASTGAVNALSTGFFIDPSDASGMTVLATFSGYGSGRIQRSTNGGQNWTSLHGDLPNIPLYSVAVDPNQPNRIFVGSELGLWVSENGLSANPHWENYTYGPALTRVVALEFSDANTLWLATHGRGIYRATKIPFSVQAENLIAVEGDGDAYLDLGETATLPLAIHYSGPASASVPTLTVTSLTPGLNVLEQAPLPSDLSKTPSFTTGVKLKLDQLASPLSEGQLTISLNFGEFQATYPITVPLGGSLASTTGTFFDGAEGEGLMQGEALLGPNDWAAVTNQVHSGSGAWFSADLEYYSDKSLVSPWLSIQPASQLSFWIYYDMEGNFQQYWDGAVLEARTRNSEWTDLESAISGATYDGQLFNNSTLAYRNAWSGSKRQWRQVTVALGSLYGESDIQFRIRVACDTAAANAGGGVWLDDIQVTNAGYASAPQPDSNPCNTCSGLQGSAYANRYYLPEIQSGTDSDMRIGLVNPQATNLAYDIHAFSANGIVLGIHEGILPGKGKLDQTVAQLFGDVHHLVSWVQVGTDQEAHVYGEIMDAQNRSAFNASIGLDTRLYMPHVAKNTTKFSTHLSSVNAGPIAAAAQLEAKPTSQTAAIDGHQKPYASESLNLQTYLGTDLNPVDWVELTSDQGLAAMEFFRVLPQETQLASLGLENQPSKDLYFLHIATDTGQFWTGMVYINVGSVAAQVTETYYQADGSVLSSRTYSLGPNGKTTLLFDHEGSAIVPAGSAWLSVSADQNLIGYELFGSSVLSQNDFFAGFQSATQAGMGMRFTHLERSTNSFTGLVALNLGSSADDLTYRAYDSKGNILETVTLSGIGPKQKVTRLASQIFSATTLQTAVWAEATGGQPNWAGFEIWGDLSIPARIHLSGIRAERIP
ncbi:MAG: hypothetical protein H6510_15135 [Acidobacteria bacterium]|nr:hypothetical protein [Acidobacteriota bacterium]MCB9399148.1 hypothetical protein [Acidobacteriota bacterium]